MLCLLMLGVRHLIRNNLDRISWSFYRKLEVFFTNKFNFTGHESCHK